MNSDGTTGAGMCPRCGSLLLRAVRIEHGGDWLPRRIVFLVLLVVQVEGKMNADLKATIERLRKIIAYKSAAPVDSEIALCVGTGADGLLKVTFEELDALLDALATAEARNGELAHELEGALQNAGDLQARIAALEAAIIGLLNADDIDDAIHDAFGHCRVCGWKNKHSADCPLALLRAALQGADDAPTP